MDGSRIDTDLHTHWLTAKKMFDQWKQDVAAIHQLVDARGLVEKDTVQDKKVHPVIIIDIQP